MKIFSYKIRISHKIIGVALLLFSLINLKNVVSAGIRIYPHINDVTYFSSTGNIFGRIALDIIILTVLLFILYSGFFYIKTKKETLVEDEIIKIATWIQKISIFILILFGALPTIWCLLSVYFPGRPLPAESVICSLPLLVINVIAGALMFIGSIILMVRNLLKIYGARKNSN